MCTEPIYIKNPKLKKDRPELNRSFAPYDVHTDKSVITCECGHCGECLQKMINEHCIRAYYEFLDVTEYQQKLGLVGHCYWNTLTYDQEHVPVYQGMLTFSLRHRQLFLKKLRDRLCKYLGLQSLSVCRKYRGKSYETSLFKYYWCCEYGDTYSRPHYHPLFFIYADIDPMTFGKMVDECWEYGYTMFNNPHGKNGKSNPYYKQYGKSEITDNGGAIQYVTKYASKGSDFIRACNDQKYSTLLSHINSILETRNQPLISEITSINQLRNIDINLDDCLPSQKFSQRFGIYAIEKCSDDQLLLGRIPMPDQAKGVKYANISYLDNKLFYNYDPTGKIRYPNEDFLKMRDLRQQHNIDYVEKHTFELINTIEKYCLINFHFRKQVNDILVRSSETARQKIPKNFTDFIHSNKLRDYNNLFELATYKVLFYGRENYHLDLLKWSKMYPLTTEYHKKIMCDDDLMFYKKLYDVRYCYYMDYYIDVLDKCQAALGKVKQRLYVEKKLNEESEELSFNFYNQNMYNY